MTSIMVTDEETEEIIEKGKAVMDILFTNHEDYSSLKVTSIYADTIYPQLAVDYVINKHKPEDEKFEIFIPSITLTIFVFKAALSKKEEERHLDGYLYSF